VKNGWLGVNQLFNELIDVNSTILTMAKGRPKGVKNEEKYYRASVGSAKHPKKMAKDVRVKETFRLKDGSTHIIVLKTKSSGLKKSPDHPDYKKPSVAVTQTVIPSPVAKRTRMSTKRGR